MANKADKEKMLDDQGELLGVFCIFPATQSVSLQLTGYITENN